MTRARILMQMHVSFLKSKTHALWYLSVSDNADSESGVFILHVLHISAISAGTSIFYLHILPLFWLFLHILLLFPFSGIFCHFFDFSGIFCLFSMFWCISRPLEQVQDFFFKPIHGMGQSLQCRSSLTAIFIYLTIRVGIIWLTLVFSDEYSGNGWSINY